MKTVLLSSCVILFVRTLFARKSNEEKLWEKEEKENSHFIEYAADVMSTLKKDHNFYEIEDTMRNPKSTVRTLLKILIAMSNDTLTKLNRIKSKEARRYLKENLPQKSGAKPAMPDYMSIGEPEKFNAVDLHLLITKEMNNIGFIVYAGRVMTTLDTDPSYEGMKEKLRDPKSSERSLLNMLSAMSNSTRTELNKIKTHEAQRYLKECPLQKGGTTPVKPDYIDIDDPEKFNAIDLHLLIGTISKMRPVLEKFMNGTTRSRS